MAAGRLRDPAADPADDLRRGDGPLRLRQARPALRPGARRAAPSYFAARRSGCSRRRYVGAVVMPGGAAQTRKELDGWQDWAKARGARGLAYVLVGEDGEPRGPVAKNLSDEELAGLAAQSAPSPATRSSSPPASRPPAQALLGAARIEIGRRCGLIDESAWAFCWVVDAPMFEPSSAARASGDVASAPGRGPPCTTRSPRPSRSGWTASRRTPSRRSPTPTTSSATATRSAAGRSVSTAATCSSGSSRSWASPTTRRRTSSASCSTPSRTAPRRTAASPSAGTGSACCWPAPTRSATSSPSPRPVAATTR